jgi:hypothetical protein
MIDFFFAPDNTLTFRQPGEGRGGVFWRASLYQSLAPAFAGVTIDRGK